MSSLGTTILLLTAVAALGTPLIKENEDLVLEAQLDCETDNGAKEDYPGAQVWKISTEKEGTRAVLEDMRRRNLISTWDENRLSIDILVKPNTMQYVKRALERDNFNYVVVIKDVQKKIDEQNPPLDENEKRLQDKRGYRMTWKKYHRLNDIHQYLDHLAETYPAYIRVQSIGKSYEGNDMKLLKISNGQPENKAVFIDGGIHAREWISPATVTYFINQIAENFSVESNDIRNIDWYFLPVLNPDGYEFSHTDFRTWRKNRKPNSNSSCIGVDLNRNFGYKWAGAGSSDKPCSDAYHGPAAFSESESKAVSDYIKSSSANFSAYLTYHSYGQYILYPWGHANVLPPDYKDLDTLGNKMAEAIKQTGESKYRVGSSAGLLGPAAGGSDDWTKSVGIKYSYTIELPDKGIHGFLLPASYIEPVGKESLAGLRVFATQILKE